MRRTVVVLLVAMLALPWSTGVSGAQEPGDGGPADGVSEEMRVTGMTHRRLRTVVIPSVCGLPRARLVNGRHPRSRTYPQDGPAAWIIGYHPNENRRPATRLGDLNRNRIRDGLIVVQCQFTTLSNYAFQHVFAYRANGTFMGRLPIGRSIRPSWAPILVDLNWTFIRNQTARVRVLHYLPSDARCCPSLSSNLRFHWVNGAFRLVR